MFDEMKAKLGVSCIFQDAPRPIESGSIHLRIKVVCARGLKPKDITSGMDPYLLIKSMESDVLCSTNILTGTISPCWNKVYYLRSNFPSTLKVNLYDKEAIGDDVYGKGLLYANRALIPQSYQTQSFWLNLAKSSRVFLRVSTENMIGGDVTEAYLQYLEQSLTSSYCDMKSCIVYQVCMLLPLRSI
jgi:hypothetical protein